MPAEEFNKVQNECDGTLPSTATLAIADLINQGPKTLDIRGITFGKTGYCDRYKNDQWRKNAPNRARTTKHNPDKQIEFFKLLLKKHNFILIDEELKNVLDFVS